MATGALVGATGLAIRSRQAEAAAVVDSHLRRLGNRLKCIRIQSAGGELSASRKGSTKARCSSSSSEAVTADGNVMLFDDNANELEEFIASVQDKLVVLDISTKTCGPCKVIYPKLVKMSLEYPNAVFVKINGDYSNGTRALMRKWQVRAVPTFRFFRNGEMLHTHSGANEDELRANFFTHYASAVAADINVN